MAWLPVKNLVLGEFPFWFRPWGRSLVRLGLFWGAEEARTRREARTLCWASSRSGFGPGGGLLSGWVCSGGQRKRGQGGKQELGKKSAFCLSRQTRLESLRLAGDC